MRVVSLIFAFTINTFSQSVWIEQVSGVTVSLNSVVKSGWLGAAWVCGNNGTVLRTTNLGTNWLPVGGNGIPTDINLNAVSVSYLNPSGAFVSGVKNDTAIVYRTSNNGGNWNIVFRQAGGKINGIDVKYLFGFMIGNPVGGRWSVWKTTNDGLNWDSTGLFIQQNNSETGWNNSFHYVSENIFFGTNNNRMYVSTNNGVSWSFIFLGNMSSTTGIVMGAFAPGLYHGYIAGLGKIYFTSNNGSSWISDSSMPGTGNIVGIASQPLPVDLLGYENLFITRGDNRILYCLNSGSNWSVDYTAPAGIYKHISKSAFDYFAVRDNGGISFCGCRIIGVNSTESEISAVYSISQNYPNPFNPITSIKFDLPESGFVELVIYDINGREITKLVQQQMNAGSYSEDWDASNYASGVYFYTLKSRDFTLTRKLVLLK